MNETIEQFLIKEITKLYTSRNQSPIKGLIEVWMDDLKMYHPESIKKAFDEVRRHGGAFPSLPEIIRLIEHKPDADTAALIGWSNVLTASKERTGKNMTQSSKKCLQSLGIGLTEVIEADPFKLGVIERDFKKLYVAMEQGIIEQPLLDASSEVKKIVGNFAELPFRS